MTDPTDIAEIAAEAVKTAGILESDRIHVDLLPDTRVKRTSLLITETQAEYEDSFASSDEYGTYKSTLQFTVVSADPAKAKRLCREAAETAIRYFEIRIQPYKGPVHFVQRLGKENGMANSTGYEGMFASQRTILVIHQFEPI